MADQIVSTPAAAEGEQEVRVALWEVGHFDLPSICWKAREAGVKVKQWLAYRLTGYEYRQSEYGLCVVLVFAVLPVASQDDAPEGWACTSGM